MSLSSPFDRRVVAWLATSPLTFVAAGEAGAGAPPMDRRGGQAIGPEAH